MYLGYLLVTKNKQDLISQKKQILDYAESNKIGIRDYILHTEKQKKIDTILKHLDIITHTIIVTELGNFGNNLLESLNIINQLIDNNVDIIFINQPELSTTNGEGIQNIYKYLLDVEKGFISKRTKKGLEAAKAKGKMLGRPKGKRNKNRILDPHFKEILFFLNNQMPVNAILKHLQIELKTPISYTALKYYIENDKVLKKARDNFKDGSLFK